jgi:hypothetical protein
MRLGKLIELLEDIGESHGDLDVRAGLISSADAVTGVWIKQTLNSHPFVILATPNKESNAA